jgi:hypothetical protein
LWGLGKIGKKNLVKNWQKCAKTNKKFVKNDERFEHTIFFKIFLKSSIFAQKWGHFWFLTPKVLADGDILESEQQGQR